MAQQFKDQGGPATMDPSPFMRWLTSQRELGTVDARELSLLDHANWPRKKDIKNNSSEMNRKKKKSNNNNKK